MKADPHITIDRVEAVHPDEEFLSAQGIRQNIVDGCRIYMLGELTINTHSGDGVRPITVGDIRGAYHSISFHVDLMAKFKSVGKDEKQERKKQWREESSKPYVGNSFGRNAYIKYVRLDLSLPAEILKRNFADYVKAQSKDVQVKSPFFKNQDFSVWYNSGVLPYLDLLLWEMKSGQTFRWSTFTDTLNLITDQPVGSEDSCRKTAKTLADKLMDERTIRMLNFQAVKEQAEGRKKSGKLFVR